MLWDARALHAVTGCDFRRKMRKAVPGKARHGPRVSGIELRAELAGEAEDHDLARRQGDGLVGLGVAPLA